jgi:hypothetical protein
MKKILLAAVAVFTIGFASSSFAGGCGTPYYAVEKSYCAPQYTYIVKEQCHKQVVTVPVYKPVHIQEKVIIKQPCHTTYVKPYVETYQVQTPVFYNYNYNYDYGCRPAYNYYSSGCGY